MKLRFLKCNRCGNVVVKVADSTVAPFCCGREMTPLVPNTTDASIESHAPQLTRMDYLTLKVEVGSKKHPMTYEHHILFIVAETEHGWQVIHLPPSGTPEALFLVGPNIVAVYAYCNVHGLWMTHIP